MMRNINLLPRKPFAEQYFIVLLGAVVLFFILIGGWMTYSYLEAKSNLTNVHEKIESTQLQTQAARSRLTPSEMLQQYNVFIRDIGKLQAASRDWMPVFESVSLPLPSQARVKDLTMATDGALTANYQFAVLQDVASYIGILETDPSIRSVRIDRLKLEPYSYTSEVDEQTDIPPVFGFPEAGEPEPNPEPIVTAPQQTEAERYLEALKARFPEPASESEAALQKLEWEIEKKRALALYNLTLPASPMELVIEESPFQDPRYDIFSPEELKAAMEELELYIQQQSIESDTGTIPSKQDEFTFPSTTDTVTDSQPNVVTEEEPERLVYNVTLHIQFAPHGSTEQKE